MAFTDEFAPGHLVDVHGDGSRGVVLLWHGRAANSRSELQGFAEVIAEHGTRVVVPDWNYEDSDGGKKTLLASVAFARRLAEQIGTDPHHLVLVGWSLGGTAALGLVSSLDERFARVVLLAPADSPRAVVPFTGEPLPEAFPDGAQRPPVDFVSPVSDDIATPSMVKGLATRLASSGWSTSWTDIEADHWSIVMTRFDTEADRGVPADNDAALAVGRQVAAIIGRRTANS